MPCCEFLTTIFLSEVFLATVGTVNDKSLTVFIFLLALPIPSFLSTNPFEQTCYPLRLQWKKGTDTVFKEIIIHQRNLGWVLQIRLELGGKRGPWSNTSSCQGYLPESDIWLELRLSKMNAVEKREVRDQRAGSEGKWYRQECFTWATAPGSVEENRRSSDIRLDKGCLRKGYMYFLDQFQLFSGWWLVFFF